MSQSPKDVRVGVNVFALAAIYDCLERSESPSRDQELPDVNALSTSFTNFRVNASVGLTRSTVRNVDTVIDTGAGPNLVREESLPSGWQR